MPASGSKSNLKRNWYLLVAGYGLHGLVFWYAIEKLFYQEIGISFTEVGVLAAIAGTGTLLFEFPSGILADRWSRRKTLALASVVLLLGAIIMGSAGGFAGYAVGTFLWGIYFAIQSGTAEALTYDMLAEHNKTDKFETYLIVISGVQGAMIAIGSIVGSIIADQVGFRETYFLSVIPAFVSIFVFLGIQEQAIQQRTGDSIGHALQSFRNAFKKSDVLPNSLLTIVIGIFFGILYEFFQVYYIAIDLNTLMFGIGNALVSLSFTVAGVLAVGMRKVNKDWLYFLAASILFFGTAAQYFVRSSYGIVLPIIVAAVFIAFEIFNERELQDRIPSEERASTTSLLGAIGRLIFFPLGVYIGIISDNSSYFDSIYLQAAVALAAVVLLVPVIRNRHQQKPKFVAEDPVT